LGTSGEYLERSERLIGMIDEDPLSETPPYFRSLEVLSEMHDIRELRDPKRGHRLIVLRPQLEAWLIAAAEAAGVELRGLGPSHRPQDLHREINSRLDAVKQLVKALEEAESPQMRHLRRLLRAAS
jgi:flavin-dependent dehydrogenase